jgi:hypothetical protein
MSKQNGPGRPKKKKQISPLEYKGIVGEPTEPDTSFEMIITEPCTFLHYLQTLKSNETESIKIFATKDRIVFRAVIDAKPTSYSDIDRASEPKSMFIEIEGSEIFSYYCKDPICMEISSIGALDGMIEYLDQYSEHISIFVRKNICNNLYFKIYNTHLIVEISSYVEARISSPEARFDALYYSPKFDHNSIYVTFEQYMAEHFKKLLVKKSTKKAVGFSLTAKGSILKIEITTDKKIADVFTFNVESNDSINILHPDELYAVHFPKKDVFKFITHIKSKIDIHMNKTQILMYHRDLGMSMCSVVALSA